MWEWLAALALAADCPTQTWYSRAFAKEIGRENAEVCARQCPYPLGYFWEEWGAGDSARRVRVCGRCPLNAPFVGRAGRECAAAATCGARSAFLLESAIGVGTSGDSGGSGGSGGPEAAEARETLAAVYKALLNTGCTICEDAGATEREFRVVVPPAETNVGRGVAGARFWASTTVGDQTRALFMTADQVFYRQENNSRRFVQANVNTTKFHPITGIYPALHDFLITTRDGYAFYYWERDSAGNITYCHVEAAAGD